MPEPRLGAALPPGDPQALGASLRQGPGGPGVNLAVWAPEATRLWLCLFDEDGHTERERRPLVQRSEEGIWHGWLAGAGAGLVYGWRAEGPWNPAQGLRFNPQRLLLDPYARQIVGRYQAATPEQAARYLGHDPANPGEPHRVDNADVALKARVLPAWAPGPGEQAGFRPRVDPSRRVIAEVHVKSATRNHPGIEPELRGSYAALAHPLMMAHWQRLGVTTLELLPIQQRLDESRLQALGLTNHWGYSSIGFFAPEPRYWSGRPGTTAEGELREAIAALQAAGFEVVLDVVFNHTAENDETTGPTLSWRGLCNRQAYRLDPQQPARSLDWTGCGNALNLAEPLVLRLVLDSLRHWVQCYGVDGFRFDLATTLARGSQGGFDAGGAFLAAMAADPLLRERLRIAEPWDLGPHGYRAGAFPPGWLEWNDRSRDAFRAYWLRPEDSRSRRAEFAQRLAGSQERFGADARRPRSPLAGVNFISAHDGFTLLDLLSFNHRHNHANGEGNRDGHHDNLSCNAGHEGPSADPAVLALRARRQRALLATLLLARGTPLLLMGDEIGHSQQGNNNAYCQDNALTWLNWAVADTALCDYTARLIALRAAHPALHSVQWLTGLAGADGRPDVAWATPEGQPLSAEDWHDPNRRGLRVWLASPHADAAELVLLFNPHEAPIPAVLPALPELPQPTPGPAGWFAWLHSDSIRGEPATAQAAPGPLQLPACSVQVWASRALPDAVLTKASAAAWPVPQQ